MNNKESQEEYGICLACGAVIHGRTDKHFCSLSCKNAFHNRTLQERRRQRTKIIAALSVNYTVLEALLNKGETGARLYELSEQGFNPAYVTAHRRGRFKHDEYACFDIWYYRTDTRIFNVRRKASDLR